MLRGRFQIILTMLLATSIVLGSLTPPAVQHTHSNGDSDHDHRAKIVASHSHTQDYSHFHHHTYHQSEKSVSTISDKGSTHVHLTILGFEFVWPQGRPGDAPRDEQSDGNDTETLIRWLDKDINLSAATHFELQTSSLPISTERPDEDFSGKLYLQAAIAMRASLPLCGAARFEQSGVQQI